MKIGSTVYLVRERNSETLVPSNTTSVPPLLNGAISI